MAVSRFPDVSPMHYFPAAVLCKSLRTSTSPPRDRQQTSWTGKACPGDVLAFLPWPAFHSLFSTHDLNRFYGNCHSLFFFFFSPLREGVLTLSFKEERVRTLQIASNQNMGPAWKTISLSTALPSPHTHTYHVELSSWLLKLFFWSTLFSPLLWLIPSIPGCLWRHRLLKMDPWIQAQRPLSLSLIIYGLFFLISHEHIHYPSSCLMVLFLPLLGYWRPSLVYAIRISDGCLPFAK